jgi:hypothetical protein
MSYVTITIEGGLIPDDLLQAVADGSAPGQRAADFGIGSARLADEIQRAFADAQSYWSAFKHRHERAAKGGRESITTITRESWVVPLLEALGYELAFRRTLTIGDGTTSFVISHTAGEEPGAPPINIVSFDDSLDERGGGRRSAYSAVQEYLNQSDAVWGLVTNGRQLRLLRNSSRITRPRYIEFDLAGMMDSNVYSEFHLLYRLLHRTRLPRSAADTSESWIEKYYDEGIQQGGRVRDRLRDGVVEALKILGNAFIAHPQSAHLRQQIEDGSLTAAAYYRELLRLVYRLLFLMVAEERRLMFPDTKENDQRRAIFTEHYGTARLRVRAEGYIGDDPETDLWEGLKQTFFILSDDKAAHMLGMAALNGELFGTHGCPHLDGGRLPEQSACCRNDRLLHAMHHLSTFDDEGTRRRVNFGALDVEELGSVYESLLEYHPDVQSPLPDQGEAQGEGPFRLIEGSERKTTGSYYTPPDLVRELINSALVPVMEDRLASAKTKEERERAILSMRVIDPAAGSGHFLLAAARRMGRELARIRTGEEEPPPPEFRKAVRDVIRECIHAVDKNPLAVDLCKVALWIEGHNAGQPLSFLDHHIKCGDSLVGVFDLKVLGEGIPDGAYKAVEGDDKAAATHYRRLNRETKKDRPTLPFKLPHDVAAALEDLSHSDERSPEDVARKGEKYGELMHRPAMTSLENACNAWTAAFFVSLRMPEYRGQDLVPTTSTVWERLSGRQIYGKLDGEITKAAIANSFFHWPLGFPNVFLRGGFDVVLGNPPWERIKLQEKEFFASRDPEIANAPNKAAREKLIKQLPKQKPHLAEQWATAVHAAEAQSKFVRDSGRFPLCGRGDVNTYSIFAELARLLAGKSGRAGIIVPSGIATDDTTKFFFRDITESHALASLYDFENRKGIFPGVHRSYKFCLLTMVGGSRAAAADFVFFALAVDELREPQRRISLSAEDIALLNPNTRTCPIFRTKRDAEITKAIYRRVPVLIKEGPPEENPWGIQFLRMFDMSNDSHLFRTREQLAAEEFSLHGNIFLRGETTYLPLYEAKMTNLFDHRHGSVVGADNLSELSGVPAQATTDAEHRDPHFSPLPRYWVEAAEVMKRIRSIGWQKRFFINTRDVARSTDVRTAIQAVIPAYGVGHKAPLILPFAHQDLLPAFYAAMNSFCFDYLIRQTIGGASLSYFILKQTPVPPPERLRSIYQLVRPRVLELTYTAWDIRPFAIDQGYAGPPFVWNEERRFVIRCELDAAFFHLYGISRDDVDYIMETFPIVKRKDERDFDEYRTKRVILEIYDEMERAKVTGKPYQTRLDPPPGDPRAAHQPASRKTHPHAAGPA